MMLTAVVGDEMEVVVRPNLWLVLLQKGIEDGREERMGAFTGIFCCFLCAFFVCDVEAFYSVVKGRGSFGGG